MTKDSHAPGSPDAEPGALLAETLAAIRPPDGVAAAAARERQAQLTKPPGSLGFLEDLSVRLAGIAGECPPAVPEPAAVAVFAADHGVHAQGVTPWPQEVTAQMVANFLASTAVVNVLAAQAAAEVRVVDVGVAADPAEVTGRGTGVDDHTLAHKVDVVRRALDRHRPDPGDPLGALAAVGCMIAGHQSTEPGAGRALPVVQAAARVLRDVATFDSAGVSGAKQ
jgi:NaMN:DMB phosphoribosyltransferase